MIPPSHKKVSVIIPTLNRGSVLLKTIEYLVNQTYSNYEIIIVDQTEKTDVEYTSKLKAFVSNYDVTYLKANHWKGTPRARNVGIAHSKGDIIIFLDDDVYLEKTYIESVAAEFSKNDALMAVAGRVLAPKPNTNITCINDGIAFSSKWSSNEEKVIDSAIGCNMALRREVYDNFHFLYDESYLGNAMNEESDPFMQMQKHNLLVKFCPKCCVIHLGEKQGGSRYLQGSSFKKLIQHYTYHSFNNYHFYKKYNSLIKTSFICLKQLFFGLLYLRRQPKELLATLLGFVPGIAIEYFGSRVEKNSSSPVSINFLTS